MADLYTSLVRAKQELNDGVLPPMTPVPENVQHFIDPAFTPGREVYRAPTCWAGSGKRYWEFLFDAGH